MASQAHAFYCFEVLAASYTKDDYPNLKEVEDLYDQYLARNDSDKSETLPADLPQDSTVRSTHQQTTSAQLPSIARLRDLTPNSTSTSSLSTPSSTSVNSSVTQLTTSTTATDLSPTPPTYASRLSHTESFPLFVTWNTITRSNQKHLRGCIGTFTPLPLESGLNQYALTSAFEDTRFSPIPASLLSSLSCSLTLLSDFQETDGPLDWELGEHGIRISFTYRSQRYGATYLPDVAIEQGWTKEETIESLMRKAGWGGYGVARRLRDKKPWEDVKDFVTIRYAGLQASADYTDWEEWRQWAQAKRPDLWD